MSETGGTPSEVVKSAARDRRSRHEWLERYTRHPGLMTGLVILVMLLVIAIAAPVLAPYEPTKTDLGNTLAHPTSQHLSLIHISEPTRPVGISRMPSSA